jgi:uncharacterized membrane protein YbhN (UPF0104 family)
MAHRLREFLRQVPALGWVMGIGLLVGLALLVHFSIGWGQLLRPWLGVPTGTLLSALVLVFLSYLVRAARLHQYFVPATRGHFLRTFRIQLLHNLFNNLLPMRTGEASFPILMKQNYDVPLSRSLPGLLYLRLMDLHFLVVVALTVISVGDRREGWLLVLVVAPMPFLAFRAQGWIRRRFGTGAALRSKPETPQGSFAPAPGSEAEAWSDPGSGKLKSLLRKSLEGLPGTPFLFWLIWLWTGVNWSVKLLVYAWILTVFSPMPYTYALLGSITGEISSVLPVHGLAGAGTYEAGIMVGLLPRDLDVQAALTGAVNLHLFVLGASVLSGALALLIPVRDRSE